MRPIGLALLLLASGCAVTPTLLVPSAVPTMPPRGARAFEVEAAGVQYDNGKGLDGNATGWLTRYVGAWGSLGQLNGGYRRVASRTPDCPDCLFFTTYTVRWDTFEEEHRQHSGGLAVHLPVTERVAVLAAVGTAQTRMQGGRSAANGKDWRVRAQGPVGQAGLVLQQGKVSVTLFGGVHQFAVQGARRDQPTLDQAERLPYGGFVGVVDMADAPVSFTFRYLGVAERVLFDGEGESFRLGSATTQVGVRLRFGSKGR